MEILLVAFITGITTGGLSCLAVQGGLLASSLAGQIEKDLQAATLKTKRMKQVKRRRTANRVKLARPILAFLVAKVLAYTLLGFLLGWVGQIFQLSLYARAFLQIGIGIFMLGSALRMLNVHPIFRYFVFEPPAFLRRMLRRTSAQADSTSLSTPIFLGLMTVLIPCGVTQAMMAVALGTGNPVQGAALMFAFTLGTSPVFFAVSYFATQLGKRLEKRFMAFVAVVVLILALVTIDSGITLAGSPVSVSRWLNRSLRSSQANATKPVDALQVYDPSAAGPALPESAAVANGSVVTITVENYGYSPDVAHAKAGEPVTLRLVTNNVRSCSRAIIIPSVGVQKILKQTGEALIEIPAQAKGTQMPYSCSMGMYSGTIIFDL